MLSTGVCGVMVSEKYGKLSLNYRQIPTDIINESNISKSCKAVKQEQDIFNNLLTVLLI